MEVIDTAAHVTRGKGCLGIGIVGEIHFQLAGGIQREAGRATTAGESVAGAVKVKQEGAGKLLTWADASGCEFVLALGGQLKGDDGTANGGEDVTGIAISVFMEAGHNGFFFLREAFFQFCD